MLLLLSLLLWFTEVAVSVMKDGLTTIRLSRQEKHRVEGPLTARRIEDFSIYRSCRITLEFMSFIPLYI